MIYKGISIVKENNFFVSRGLRSFIGGEINILAGVRTDDAYGNVFRYLIDYIVDTKAVIKADQTIGYRSWILKFHAMGDNDLMMYEGDERGTGFIAGVDTAIKVIEDQEAVCKKYDAIPVFPTFSQLLMCSKGVAEGLAVDGVRYPSPAHMSGWWLTTALYDDNVHSMTSEHYYHVAFSRPALLQFLALPFGFRFFFGANGETEVYYDEEVMKA